MAPIFDPINAVYSFLYFMGFGNSSLFKSPPSLSRRSRKRKASRFTPKCHPLIKPVSAEVNKYFLEHWEFDDEREKKKFTSGGFCTVTCFYFPNAIDDRLHFACRLLTILFLIDDLLDDMSFDEGSQYNENLIPICRGDVKPNRSIPAEYIMYDLWESMRACDKELADGLLDPVFEFMRAQTDKTRLSIKGLGAYLEYRERDVGKAVLCALMRFVTGVPLDNEQLELVRPIERNYAKHLSVVNDIYSWEKELEKSKTGHEEGAAICSAVQTLHEETNLSYDETKTALWAMCRGWEAKHDALVAQLPVDDKVLQAYVQGIEYLISGNEIWSATTLRYHTS